VAFYCTAGKDRTGLIAMLVLSALGVDNESIVNDYVLSDSVYADLNDKDAMVGALQQQQVSACFTLCNTNIKCFSVLQWPP
jgi:protein tyrosine/serine phosphatase